MSGVGLVKVVRIPGPADERLRVAVNQLQGVRGKVGWFKSSRYPDGTPVALVAAVQEYGWPEHNIPPRLGMRATADAKRADWARVADHGAKAVLAGTMTGVQAMELIGLAAAGDVRKHISEVRSPPLQVSTVKARLAGRKQGRVVSITISKPLVDTGYMLGTLTNATEKLK